MENRKITESEKKRVKGFCEFVALFIASVFVNIKLAVVILFAAPIIISIIVGIKDKNYHFFNEENKKTKALTT